MREKEYVIGVGTEKLNSLARECGMVRRASGKISASGYLSALCRLTTKGSVSFNDMAGTIGLSAGVAVSKQAVWKRTDEDALAFLRAVLELVIGEKTRSPGRCCPRLFTRFRRVVLQDSTCVKLSRKHVEKFPGVVNQHSKASNLKIQAAYDLKAEKFVEFRHSAFSKNDQKASPDILDILCAGDLLIRDMGYFVTCVFGDLAERGIFFLSRLRFGTTLLCPATGAKIDLYALLKKKGNVDMDVLMGEERVPVRLVAARVPEQVGAARRRKAAADKDKRTNHSERYYKLMDWNIYITNVPPAVWSSKDVDAVYPLRWRIETIFKAWKSNMCLEHLHQSISETQLIATILARMAVCVHLLADSLARTTGEIFETTGRFVSMLKFVRLIQNNPDALHLPPKVFASVVQVCCIYEQRKRSNFMTKMSEA